MPSENVDTSDRRTRKRAERRAHLLDLAAELVEEVGVDGVTMAALAEAADYAPASLYTYFPSRSALLADLQARALAVLREVAEERRRRDDAHLAAHPELDPVVAHLARLWSFSELFLTAPEHHPREFRLQQQLLVTPDVESAEDAGRVVPAAFEVLAVPAELLTAAAAGGALTEDVAVDDPLGAPLPPALVRTLAWVLALNGALLTDRLVLGLPTTGRILGDHLTRTLLAGWGASPEASARAEALVAGWTDAGGDR